MLFNRKQGACPTAETCLGNSREEPPRHTADTAAIADCLSGDNDRPSSVIGAQLSISGDLESKGDVVVDGRVRGNVSCKRLTVGPDGSIDGDILANEAIIRGKVTGPIRAANVCIEASAHVEGYIYYATLSLERGAVFQGVSRCKRNFGSIDVATERQVAKLNAKAAEMLAQTGSELPGEEPASMPQLLAGFSPAPPAPVNRTGNGRKVALP